MKEYLIFLGLLSVIHNSFKLRNNLILYSLTNEVTITVRTGHVLLQILPECITHDGTYMQLDIANPELISNQKSTYCFKLFTKYFLNSLKAIIIYDMRF